MTTAVADVRSRDLRVVAGAMHLSLALLLVQAVLAGFFVGDTYANNHGGGGLVTVHGVVADVIWILVLLAAGFILVRLRRTSPLLLVLAVAYFVLALAEAGIGHLISDNAFLGISGNRNGLIAAHIPIAIVLFALGGVIANRAIRQAHDRPREALGERVPPTKQRAL